MTNAEKQAAWRKRRAEALQTLRVENTELPNQLAGLRKGAPGDGQHAVATFTGPDLSAFAVQRTPSYHYEPVPNADSKPIVVYGQTIWPPAEGATYSFQEAWAAFHFWQDEDRYVAVAESRPEVRARHFMPMSRWLEYVSHGFASAWLRITRAQHAHPEMNSPEHTHAPGRRPRGK